MYRFAANLASKARVARNTTHQIGGRLSWSRNYAAEDYNLVIRGVEEIVDAVGVTMGPKAELRASVFEAIEEEDKTIEKEEGLPPVLLGSCNDCAKQLHASPSGDESATISGPFLQEDVLSLKGLEFIPEQAEPAEAAPELAMASPSPLLS